MKVYRNVTTALAAITVLVSALAFNSNDNLPIIADRWSTEYISVNNDGQRSAVPVAHSGAFSLDRSAAPNLALTKLTGASGSSGLPVPEPEDGITGGRALPSPSIAATLLDDTFDRPDSDLVGAGWVEVEQTGASAVISGNQLFFADTSDVANRPLVRRSFPLVSTGTLQWDFDFDWAQTNHESLYRLVMQLGYSTAMSDTAPDAGVGVNLIWTIIDGAHQSLGSRNGGVNTSHGELSGPARISVVADLATQTYSLAVDGSTLGAGIPFDANVPLDTVRFFTADLDEQKFSGRTIDNLSISSSDATPPVNTPPQAQNQQVSTVEDTPRSITLTATDPVDCQLEFSIVTGPTNGSLGVIADHPCVGGSPNSDAVTLEYTPDFGFTGSDSFTWQASDGLEISGEATVSITISPQPPTLFSDTFDRPDSLMVGPDWVEVEPMGTSAVVANGQLFFAETSDAGNRPLVRRSFSQVSRGTLQWDFDFDWARIANESTYRLLMQLGDSANMTDTSQSAGAGVNLIWTKINGYHESLGYIRGGAITALAVLSGAGHISVVADLDARTYSVWVDGALVGNGIPFDSNVPLNMVRLFTDNLNEQNFSGRTIDNIGVHSASAGNVSPVANAGPDQSVEIGTTVRLDGRNSSDADGSTLAYNWTLTAAPTGSRTSLNNSRSSVPSFLADQEGTYVVELVVNDGTVDSAPDTLTVTVSLTENDVNLAPVAHSDSVTTVQDVPLDLQLSYSDADGTGPYTFEIITQPINGVLTGDGADRTYTPDPGFTGFDSFRWSVSDDRSNSNVATVSVAVYGLDGAPLAQDDTFAIFADVPLALGPVNGVLANDSSPSGHILTARLITETPIASGDLTFNGDGSFTFTPAGGFSGPVEFSYVAEAGPLVSDTAVVSINVAVPFDRSILQPADGQTGVSVNPTLEIDCSVSSTTSAQYRIATDSEFIDVVYDSGENINDICSHLAFADLNHLTSYFWQGRIQDTQGVWTPWSSPMSFTTVDAAPNFINVFQDGYRGYSGSIDADIRGSALDPTQVIREWNHGAQGVLRTGRRLPGQATDEIFRSLLKFDLAELTDPAAVINAYIELTGWEHTDSNHLFHTNNSMYQLNKPWGEGASVKDVDADTGEVSWTYAARPEAWDIPGAALASDSDPNADRSETALVRMVATNLLGHKTYWSSKNLVDAVKEWISDPSSNNGVIIQADDEMPQQTLHLASRENQDITFRPKLVIVSRQSVPNEPPTAQDQSVNTRSDLPIELALAYTDPDGPSPHSFTIVTPPSHGTLTGSGAISTYTPDSGFIGSDSFTWRVNDGLLDSNEATASVTVGETLTLISDTFDRPDSPVVGPGWIELEQAGASVAIAGNQLYFADSSDVSKRPLVSRSFAPVSSDILQWDFDFDWARTAPDAGYELWMQLGDSTLMVNPSSDLTQFLGVGVNLRWGKFNGIDQTLVARQDATVGGPKALAVISGPTQISVTIDLVARTYSVKINGAVVGSKLNFDNIGSVSKLDTVRIYTNKLDEQNFSGRAFDNLSLLSALAVNIPPVAEAGPDQVVPVGATVNLDGSGSADADGDPITFLWSLTTKPAGSGATLTGGTTPNPSFVADQAGIYSVGLVANDGTDDSATSTVSIIASEGSITLLSDTFDRDDNPVIGENWVEVEQTGAKVYIASNKLFFSHTSDVLHRPLVSKTFSPVSTGTLQWDFDFDWARIGADNGYELWMQLGDSSRMVIPTNNVDRFQGVGVDLRWGNYSNTHQNLVARQNTTKGGPTALAPISGPNHLSVSVDLVSRTYSVTINGTEVRSGLFFDDLDTEKLDTVRLFTNNLNETSFTGRTFDNMVVSME